MDAELRVSLTPKFRPRQNCGSVGANTLPSLDAPVQVIPVRLVLVNVVEVVPLADQVAEMTCTTPETESPCSLTVSAHG